MNFDDTFIVTGTADLKLRETDPPEDVAKTISGMINAMVREASQNVGKDHQQHRAFALSATPFVYNHHGHKLLFVTSIIALVPKQAFTWPTKSVGLSS